MQPLQSSNYYRFSIWKGISIYHKRNHLLIKSENQLQTLSSAVFGGGLNEATHFVNWQVPPGYVCDHPLVQIRKQIGEWGYPMDETVGLQTAASVKNVSIAEEEGKNFRVCVCVTAGTSNGARAGKVSQTYETNISGTINMFVFLYGKMSTTAMVNGIATAAEAKTAALQDLKIRDHDGKIITGTTTDSIVIAVRQTDHYHRIHHFAGTATILGDAIARLIYRSIREAVSSTEGKFV